MAKIIEYPVSVRLFPREIGTLLKTQGFNSEERPIPGEVDAGKV